MKYTFVDLTGRIGKNNEKCFAFSREDRAVFKGFCCQEIWWDIETLKLKYEQSTEHQYCTYSEFLALIPKGFFNDEEEVEIDGEMPLHQKIGIYIKKYEIESKNDNSLSVYRFLSALWTDFPTDEGKQIISAIKRSFEPTVMIKSEPEQTILDRVGGSFSGIVDVIDEGKGIELYEALTKEHKEIAEQVQSNEALLLRSELAAQRLISTFKLYFQAVKKDKITYVKDGKVYQACLEGDAIVYTVTDLTF